MIRTSLYCLAIAIAFRVLFAQTDETRTQDSEPRDIMIADHLHGNWMTIGRINHKEPGGEFAPNWTYIRLEEGVVPTMKKQGKRWYIQFDSDIAKNLP